MLSIIDKVHFKDEKSCLLLFFYNYKFKKCTICLYKRSDVVTIYSRMLWTNTCQFVKL